MLFGSRSSCKRTSYHDHRVTCVTDCLRDSMCSWFDVNMVAERRSTVLGSLSSESVERADQRAKSSGTEDGTEAEDAVEYVADWIKNLPRYKGIKEKRYKCNCRSACMYMSASLFFLFSQKTQSRTRTFHNICSKLLTFHNGFMFSLLASVSSTFAPVKPYWMCKRDEA